MIAFRDILVNYALMSDCFAVDEQKCLPLFFGGARCRSCNLRCAKMHTYSDTARVDC